MVQAEAVENDSILIGGSVLIEAREAGSESDNQSSVAIVAYNGGALIVAGYDAPVYLDLTGGNGFDRKLPLLRDHDKKRITGSVEAKIVGKTIEATGRLVGSSADRAEVEELARDGYEWQASVGARPLVVVKVPAGKRAEVNGSVVDGPAYIAKKWRLAEISLVTIGADGETTVSLAASEGDLICAELDDSSNEEPTSLTEIKLERARRKAIEAAAMGLIKQGGDIEAIEAAMQEAINAGTNAGEFELKLLRSSVRPQGRISSCGGRELRGAEMDQAIEAALMLALGYSASELEASFDERILTAMDRNVDLKNGISLRDSMRMVAELNGQRVGATDIRAMLRGSFPDINANGLSTHSLSGIFSNIANKALKASFESVENVWREISEVGSVRDFKQITSYSLTGDMTYEKVSPSGELKHATAGEKSYSNQADTYGKMFSLNRQQIINDDLGALNAIPRRLGRGAALKLNDVFWAEFLADHGDFFTSGLGNLIASGSSAPWYLIASPMDLAFIQVVFLNGRQVPIVEQADADFNQLGVQFRGYHDFGVNKQEPKAIVKSPAALDIANLAAAEKLFLDMKDYDNKPLALTPSILLTGTGNKVTASEIYNSTYVLGPTSAKTPNANVFAGKYRPIASTYLPNS